MDDERFRSQVVHGWAFRGLPAEEKAKIREYLKTGDRKHLPDTYRKIAETLKPEEN